MTLHPIVIAYCFNNHIMQVIQQATGGKRIDIQDFNKINTLGSLTEVACPDYFKLRFHTFESEIITFYLDIDTRLPVKICMGREQRHELIVNYITDGDGTTRFTLHAPGSDDVIKYTFDDNDRLIDGQTLVERYRNEYRGDDFCPEKTTWISRVGEPDAEDYPSTTSSQTDTMGYPYALVRNGRNGEGHMRIIYQEDDSYPKHLSVFRGSDIRYSIDIEKLLEIHG